MRREIEKKMKKDTDEAKKISNSFFTGVIALVFLVIGYQTAIFIQRAAVAHIVSNRDCPDTVYIYKDVGYKDVGKAVESSSAISRKENPSIIRKDASHSQSVRAVRQQHGPRYYQSFPFNPNTASVEELQLLGFSLKQAQSIDHYRKKGGRFRRKSDFAKSFVVADSVYKRLEPFIDIPPLDINQADSAAFDELPGIGGYFASRMVRHRRALGGYSCKEQLMDLKYFDEEKFNGLEDLIAVSSVPPYELWILPADSLCHHPYIGSAARSIVLYRENNPKEKWTLEDLYRATVITEDAYRKLSLCRIAPPK